MRSRCITLALLFLSLPLVAHAQRDYRVKFDEWHKANPGSSVFDPRISPATGRDERGTRSISARRPLR